MAANPSSITGRSRLSTNGSMSMGRRIALMASTRAMLAKFDPTTLPMAIPGDPTRAASMLTASSGALVPRATMVRPVTREDSPARRPSVTAARTRSSPPPARAPSPTSIKRMSFTGGFGPSWFRFPESSLYLASALNYNPRPC